MSTLPQWWFGPPPELSADETWQLNLPANRTQGKRAVGGGLHFTNRRALFTPNIIDASLGGKAWSCALGEIKHVGIVEGRFALTELFSGGLRTRFFIAMRSGDDNLFVVSSPQDVAAKVQAIIIRRPDAS
jgi:hypothetical protein